jgi:glutaminase
MLSKPTAEPSNSFIALRSRPMHSDAQRNERANDIVTRESISIRSGTLRFRILSALNELHLRYRDCHEGRVADYIPELAKADPNWFGISVVTADGQAYEVGDYDRTFTIQSMSKPFIYGLALEDRGRDAVLARVGVEPSGDPFNSIIKLDANNRPHNPMVNAGAIATTGLIAGVDPTDRLNRMLDMMGRFIGRRPGIDMSVFMSERTTGHRNRAMAHLMLNFGIIDKNVEEILDLYFQQCSVLVTARDMAVMAATLANRGVNPITGQRAINKEYIRDLLTVMHTCGMYNYAGEWAYAVGLPAKSGVAGGVIAVVPGQFGICVYSPPVDERGNSVRGIRVCEDLSRNSGIHVFDAWLESGSLLERIDTNAVPSASLSAESQTISMPTSASQGAPAPARNTRPTDNNADPAPIRPSDVVP